MTSCFVGVEGCAPFFKHAILVAKLPNFVASSRLFPLAILATKLSHKVSPASVVSIASIFIQSYF